MSELRFNVPPTANGDGTSLMIIIFFFFHLFKIVSVIIIIILKKKKKKLAQNLAFAKACTC